MPPAYLNVDLAGDRVSKAFDC